MNRNTQAGASAPVVVELKPTRDQYVDRVFTAYTASHTYDGRGAVVYVAAADLDALVADARALGLTVRRVTNNGDRATASIWGFRRGRGPQVAPTKAQISIRLSREAVEAFRATGDGWQTRIAAAVERAARRIK
jgi:uncharacterized protein (DUF4415 family)